MTLIVPHRPTITRHSRVPYLWRVVCTCRYEAFAGTEENARLCAQSHIEAEEPFPEMDFLSQPMPPED